MPFNKEREEDRLINIGYAIGDWKENDLDYQKIYGILLDIKDLMSIKTYQDREMIKLLAVKVPDNSFNN